MDARVVLRQDTASAGRARAFVRETLSTWHLEDLIDTACLLVTELVTNAVLHARCAPEVRMSRTGGTLRVEVADTSTVMPARRYYGVEAGTGRGLMLVEEMAAGWGVDASPNGKVVWFVLTPGGADATPRSITLDAETLADLADLGGLEGSDGPPGQRGAGRRDTGPAGGPGGGPGRPKARAARRRRGALAGSRR